MGETFPLQRPRLGETGCLLEQANRGYYLAMRHAAILPMFKTDERFTQKNPRELVFYSLQNIYADDYRTFSGINFLFNVTWDLTPQRASELLKKYFQFKHNKRAFLWPKDNIVILLKFDEKDCLREIAYRLLGEYNLPYLDKK